MSKLVCKSCNHIIDTREMLELDGFCSTCANAVMLSKENKMDEQKSPLHISSIHQARQIIKKLGHLDVVKSILSTGEYHKIIVKNSCSRKAFADSNLRDCLFFALLETPFEYCFRCEEFIPHLSAFINEYLILCTPTEPPQMEEEEEEALIDFFLDTCIPMCEFGFNNKCELDPLDNKGQLRWCYNNSIVYGPAIIDRYEKVAIKSLRRQRDTIIKNIAALSDEEYEKLDSPRAKVAVFDRQSTVLKVPKEKLPRIMFFERSISI